MTTSLPPSEPQTIKKGIIPPCCWKAMLWPWHRCKPMKCNCREPGFAPFGSSCPVHPIEGELD